MSCVAAASAAARIASADGTLARSAVARRLLGEHRPIADAQQRDARLGAAAVCRRARPTAATPASAKSPCRRDIS